MPKISVFGGVTNVRASGLLPDGATEVQELPVEVVDRADGSVSEVNSEFDQNADPDDTRSPNADTTGQGTDNPPPSDSGRGPTPSTSTPDTTPEVEGGQAGRDAGEAGEDGDQGEPGDSGEGAEEGKRDSGDNRVDGDADLPFDPEQLTVAEVKERLEGLSEEDRDRVIDAERLGKNRAGITGLAG